MDRQILTSLCVATIFSVFVTGCDKAQSAKTEGEKTPATAKVDAKVEAPATKVEPKPEAVTPPPMPAAAAAAPIQILPDSIGELRADTNPDTDLAKLFPAYKLATESFESEGESYTVYSLSKDGVVLWLVQPWEGRIAEATVMDPTILGPEGVHAGATIAELGIESKLTCFVEAEGEDDIFCGIDGVTHVQLLFSTEGLDVGVGDDVPISTLAGRTVEGLRWLPKSK